MAKHKTELGKMVVPKGERVSNSVSFHPRTGTVASITVFAPPGDMATLELSPGGNSFVPFLYKGNVIRLLGGFANDVPLAACDMVRVSFDKDQDDDKEFRVL